jgi:hypothetical protein
MPAPACRPTLTPARPAADHELRGMTPTVGRWSGTAWGSPADPELRGRNPRLHAAFVRFDAGKISEAGTRRPPATLPATGPG